MYENSTEKLGLRTADMAAELGVILFAYICLVFLVTDRICMMQCNPMSRPGKWRKNGRIEAVLLFSRPRLFSSLRRDNGKLYKFIPSLYSGFVISKSNTSTWNICRCISRRYGRYEVLWEPRTGKNSLSKVKGVLC